MHEAITDLRSRSQIARPNLTRLLANASMHRPEVLRLWFGEPDVPTPEFIREAGIESIRQGETFYTEGLGTPYLRSALSNYLGGLHGQSVSEDRIAVTVSGGNALNLAFQSVLSEGDRVVVPVPAFPNLLSIPALQGAEVVTHRMQFDDQGWQLNMDQLITECQRAKVVLINSPSNPNGWVMSRSEQQQLLEACRQSGTWILSDEVYSRLTFGEPAAPSFLEIAEPEDRLLVVNSFSKAWAMTGWRLGWLVVPPSLLATLERIIEFSVSSAPSFAQRAAVVALEQGEPFIAESVARYQSNLALVGEVFSAIESIDFVAPTATFYAYFRIAGVTDNMAFAQRLIDEAGVGLAPGTTFDPEATDWFRLCFAQSPERLQDALGRLLRFLG